MIFLNTGNKKNAMVDGTLFLDKKKGPKVVTIPGNAFELAVFR